VRAFFISNRSTQVIVVSSNQDVSQRLKDFIYQYTKAINNGDLVEILKMYGDQVDYYKSGYVDKNFIATDKAAYYRRWPAVENQVSSPIQIQASQITDLYVVDYDVNYRVFNPERGKSIEGNASNKLFLQVAGNSIFIVKENQWVNSRIRQ